MLIYCRCFEQVLADLRELARLLARREAEPTAVMLDTRTTQSTTESGARAGYDGTKRRKGSRVHVAVDTLGQLPTAVVTPANEPYRGQEAALFERVQQVTGQKVQVAYTDQSTGEEAQYTAGLDHAAISFPRLHRPVAGKRHFSPPPGHNRL